MKLAILPPFGFPVTCDAAWMTAFARHAEACGFESLYVVEHVVVPSGYAPVYPYGGPKGRMPLPEDCVIPDPLDLLAYLAAVTENLVLATGVLVLPEHNAVVLAKRLATIDRLSGGRLRLGCGVGWMREEAEAVGIDFATRGRRTDEAIEVLRCLWRDAEPTFKGEFFQFERARSHPKPIQAGGVPIHIGGHSVAAARRAGRLGDGFHPLGIEGDELVARLDDLRRAADAAGRDAAKIELTLGAGMLTTCDPETLAGLEQAGAGRAILATAEPDLAKLQDQMSAFAERVARA